MRSKIRVNQLGEDYFDVTVIVAVNDRQTISALKEAAKELERAVMHYESGNYNNINWESGSY